MNSYRVLKENKSNCSETESIDARLRSPPRKVGRHVKIVGRASCQGAVDSPKSALKIASKEENENQNLVLGWHDAFSTIRLDNPIRFRHSDFCRTLSQTFRETSFRRFRRINLVEACFLPARRFSLEPSPRVRRHERPYHGCRGRVAGRASPDTTQQIGSQSPAAVYRDLAAL